MLYTVATFKTKKALKEAVASGKQVAVYTESVFSSVVPDGKDALCGPGPYERKWYAEVTVKDRCIVAVK